MVAETTAKQLFGNTSSVKHLWPNMLARKTRRFRPLWWLLLLAVGLGVMWLSGGLAMLNNYAVLAALNEGQDDIASQRLGYNRWLHGAIGETEFLRARLARHSGELSLMDKHLQLAARNGLPADRIRREQSLAMAQTGQIDYALESRLNNWIASGIETREVCSAYANGLAASSRFAEARQVLEAWGQDFPQDPRPAFRLGRILEHQRRKDEALEMYVESQRRDPSFIPASYSIARILLDQRKVDEALLAFRACPGAEKSIPIQTGIAMCLKSQGKLDEAKRILEEVVSNSNETIFAAYSQVDDPTERLVAAAELGKIESDQGNFEQAKRWLKRAIAVNPRDMETRYTYAVALRGLGEKELADKEFEYVKTTREALASVNVLWDRIDSEPNNTEARLELATILLKHESKRAGMYWLKSILQYDPDNAEVAELLKEHVEP